MRGGENPFGTADLQAAGKEQESDRQETLCSGTAAWRGAAKYKRGDKIRVILSPLLYAEPHRNYALSTKPDLKQEVHTYIFFGVPLSFTFTFLMLDFHILLLLLCE